jgi:hypothetical protein
MKRNMKENMATENLSDKSILDELLLKTFVEKDKHSKPYVFYKITDRAVQLIKVNRYGVSSNANLQPEGFEPINENTYQEIKNHLVGGYIFSQPFSANLTQNIFDKNTTLVKANELDLFKEALSVFGVKRLKKNNFPFIPKKISLNDCQGLFDYHPAQLLSGKEIFSILENIPLTGHNFGEITKAFTKSFLYIKERGAKLEEVQDKSPPNPNPIDVPAYVFNLKEELIKSFMDVNPKFINKGTNRVWFKSMLSALDSDLEPDKLLGEEKIELFEIDTWKHVTVELSKHGLFQAYPMKPSISSYNAQSTYKSMLSQFATFIASNDTKLGWGLNVEQAHLNMKKNGNYLFSLSHSSEQPDGEKVQKLLKSFLDYLKPSFVSEEEDVAKAIGEVFSDKVKLKKIMSNVVLYNDLSNDLVETTTVNKRMKI